MRKQSESIKQPDTRRTAYREQNLRARGCAIDLASTMAQRECNYLRLSQLMPDWKKRTSYGNCCHLPSGGRFNLVLTITNRSAHTLVVLIDQQLDQDTLEMRWLQSMQARVYLDARSAEVIACNGRRLPNWHAGADQRKENLVTKADCDYFLSEILSFWQTNGLALPEVLPNFMQTPDKSAHTE